MSNKSSTSGGMGFVIVLTIVFVILKLCGVIAWPWLWALSPIWIGAAVDIIICVIFLIVMRRTRKKFIDDINKKFIDAEERWR